ncbi:MAG: hypothetical protein NHB15_14005 [Methanosarcina barkeri]|nr:hypothetical protein [Methanosarcina sp. ERenArc_MAG2]
MYLFKSSSEGLSPVVGSLLLLLIVFVLVGVVASSINLSGCRTNFQYPLARITLESCEGGFTVLDQPRREPGLKKIRLSLCMREEIPFHWTLSR